jgi:act minimal PKS acyl carrier protein
MAVRELTLDDLKRVLREAAGEEEGIDLDGDVLDRTFDELGYDSLALLETSSRIEREHGIKLDDSVVTNATTPRQLLAVLNEQLTADTAA